MVYSLILPSYPYIPRLVVAGVIVYVSVLVVVVVNTIVYDVGLMSVVVAVTVFLLPAQI
jgi:hypothetical protein